MLRIQLAQRLPAAALRGIGKNLFAPVRFAARSAPQNRRATYTPLRAPLVFRAHVPSRVLGNIGDMGDIVRDVFTDRPIAARGGMRSDAQTHSAKTGTGRQSSAQPYRPKRW
jgi:hypothetical protein